MSNENAVLRVTNARKGAGQIDFGDDFAAAMLALKYIVKNGGLPAILFADGENSSISDPMPDIVFAELTIAIHIEQTQPVDLSDSARWPCCQQPTPGPHHEDCMGVLQRFPEAEDPR